MRDADVVYTDVWTSMGQEVEREQRLRAFDGWTVDEALMKAATSDAVFLHCLPADRGEEVTAEVIDGPRSLVWQQAATGCTRPRALLVDLVGTAADVHARQAATAAPHPAHPREQPVSSQAQLVQMLEAEGIVATQATVSRDLEDLAR